MHLLFNILPSYIFKSFPLIYYKKEKEMIKKSVLALDMGGTKIHGISYRIKRGGLEIESEHIVPSLARESKRQVMNQIYEVIDALKQKHTKYIGVGHAGLVDVQKGKIIKSPNFKDFNNVNIAKKLSEKYKIAVHLENDAKLFALAEQKMGAVQKYSNIVGIIIGTGIGSGIIIDGKIYRGHDGFAGEIGHMINDIGDTTDHHEAKEVLLRGNKTKHLGKMPIYSYRSDLEEGTVSDTYINMLCDWLYNIYMVLNPSCIIIGGGIGKNVLAKHGDRIKERLEVIKKLHGYPCNMKIKFSKMKNAGVLGAAIFAKEQERKKRG